MSAKATIENRVYDEINVGDTASIIRMLTREDIQLFAVVSGDVNTAHVDPDYAATGLFHQVIAHGMWGSGLISAVLGTELPGPGTIYLGQSLRFCRPVSPGDTITATATVTAKDDEHNTLTLDCVCVNQDGQVVICGEANVIGPREKISRPRMALPGLRILSHERFKGLMAQACTDEPVTAAIAHPCDPSSIVGAVEAAKAKLITPILVGPEPKIRAAAEAAGVDIRSFRLVSTPHSHAAAAEAVALVASGEAKLLMKGSLHTDELMSAVLSSQAGLKTERRISHVYLMDVPSYARLLLVTDAAINIAPTLEEKADIIRNAIDCAHVIGIETPRVAILAAVETVNPKMPSTLEAAALCKMADRGQIAGALLDGPLALDNAISEDAAKNKGIVSEVAGRADILLVPNLEAGNMLAKQLTFLSGANGAGVVLGARVPIILTSRADSIESRLASAALAVLLARASPKAAPGVPS
jgi:phosphotransacetylase/acyl dehydratase